ncbi:MAG TPA: hypothetical protein VLW75_08350, partial [Rhizomicrobium sp.]|nr:hypothetical protein [Rhizomicrobium sp.]
PLKPGESVRVPVVMQFAFDDSVAGAANASYAQSPSQGMTKDNWMATEYFADQGRILLGPNDTGLVVTMHEPWSAQ